MMDYLDNLVKSRFIEMFGSVKNNVLDLKIVTLKDVCISIVDGSHNPPKGGNKSEYLMLSSKNIIDNNIPDDMQQRINEAYAIHYFAGSWHNK